MEQAERAGELYMKGFSDAEIATELGIKRREVTQALNNWRDLLRRETMSSLDIKDRVMDILVETEESLKLARKEAWSTVQQADNSGQYSTKVQALKLYRDVSRDIYEIFDKAGINQDAELIEEMNRTHEAQEKLIELLKEIKEEFPEVSRLIAQRLSRITGGDVEVMEIASE